MQGVLLKTIEDGAKLSVIIDPLIADEDTTPEKLIAFVNSSEFSKYSILTHEIEKVCNEVTTKQRRRDVNDVVKVIGEQRQASIQVNVTEDLMQAELIVSVEDGAQIPSLGDIQNALEEKGVKRGIGLKRIKLLVNSFHEKAKNTEISTIVAKGLPPREGKNSRLKPLVPNVLERILKPQKIDGNKVDMRNLGDIVSVSPGQAVAQHVPPTSGRAGFTITGDVLPAQSGEWVEIKLGENTKKSDQNENIIVSTISGQPKFDNRIMSIDEVFVTDGVNVKTGNIDYDGSVIVDGDVTEQMQIFATGDVTVNGFVESALIKADGDIIIAQGATGRMDDYNCQLFANGSVIIHHGQGLEIVCGKELHAYKQLAYSRITCRGKCVIGETENSDGAFFASSIKAYDTIHAGVAGAVSGSELEIDFTEGYEKLLSRLKSITSLHKQLVETTTNHETNYKELSDKIIPQHLLDKLDLLTNAIESERMLLSWLSTIEIDLKKELEAYKANARLIASAELYPGVFVKLGKNVWKAEKEYLASRVYLDDDAWKHELIVK